LTTFVEIAVNIPGHVGVFDYHLPESLERDVEPGCLVVVPFGSQRVQGIVLRRIEQPSVPQTKAVEALLDSAPVLLKEQLALARWLEENTLTPLSSCLELMLPPGISQQADQLYRLVEPLRIAETELSSLQRRIVLLLRERGPLRGRQIGAAFRRVNWKESLQALVRKGVLVRQPVLPEPGVKAKTIRMVRLAIDPGQIESALEQVGRAGSPAYQRRKAMLDFLVKEPWPVQAAWLYAVSGGNLSDLRRLEELGLVQLFASEIWRDPLSEIGPGEHHPPALTRDQTAVWEEIQACLGRLDQPQPPVLLHGVTGSGKTEIYLRAVEAVLQRGRRAIVLVPEIALTPQTVRRFLARFPGRVGLVHSRLSPGERYDTWRRARAGLLDVIVGPRSALFTPLPELGLIVIDECHDPSYYQSEPAPAYHSIDAAVQLARLTGSLLLLGSATPEVAMLYQARRERWRILSLPLRILAHQKTVAAQLARINRPAVPAELDGEAQFLPLPPVQIVDMRQELKAGNRSIFSRALRTSLRDVLDSQQQAILYINRLGSATYVFCRDCGYVLRCPRCERTLTWHSEAQELICHTCNYRRKMPGRCPACGSDHIRQYGTGTERVEQEVNTLFPQARTLRWDSESTRQKGAHDLILSHFTQGRADILVGTQMLAKGLDLPLVTLVGVVLADVGLSLGDYRAGERTFQLLTQVAGRAGRSPLGGKVILQTFQPEHYAIQAAARHDYDGFYRQELEQRRGIGYPPFSRLIRLEIRKARAGDAEETAVRMAGRLESWISESGMKVEIIGPAPCFFPRINNQYRWQIILRGSDPLPLLKSRDLGEWRVEVDPASLL
jgi:primosomal protein N' (replication factor Y)